MNDATRLDFAWQRAYLPALKRIAGEFLISEAPFEEDTQRNTDLIVLRLEAVRIACRVRRFEYAARYGDEFTIRCKRPGGHDTELKKVVSGWGDYILYAFAAAEGPTLARWVLGDLRVFRTWFVAAHAKGEAKRLVQKNGDGSSSFLAIPTRVLPEEFVVASSP